MPTIRVYVEVCEVAIVRVPKKYAVDPSVPYRETADLNIVCVTYAYNSSSFFIRKDKSIYKQNTFKKIM